MVDKTSVFSKGPEEPPPDVRSYNQQVICKEGGCEKTHYARGWCKMHYMRYMRHGNPHTVLRVHKADSTGDRHGREQSTERICKVDWCKKKYYAKGWCLNHYLRFYKYGDPEGGHWYIINGDRVPIESVRGEK